MPTRVLRILLISLAIPALLPEPDVSFSPILLPCCKINR
jgi:hypothetical protein